MSKPTDPHGALEPAPARPEEHSGVNNQPNQETGFDPFASLHVTVPPDVRRDFSNAQLPRLAPEFFQETLPPNHGLPEVGRPELVAYGARRRRAVGVALTLGILLACFGMGLAFFRMATRSTAPHEQPHQGVTSQQSPPIETALAAPNVATPIPAPASAVSTIEPAPQLTAPSPPRAEKRSMPKANVSNTESPGLPSSLPEAPARPASGPGFWAEPR